MSRKIRYVLLALSVVLMVTYSSDSSSLASQDAAGRPSSPLQLRGLRDRVTVRRDERGIPYIEATNDADLYFAQGYVTASDRLWQMDLL
ncbi:MAG: penicillin acylase family protein, partial [Acidobacteria bacterium]